ncbi:MAG: Flp pilus assembly complex ATPase component TadA, partial [Firmicutes bacterium]|nr:Flp pilus assembly complex ATPase component TadA [Bacillota bacterium]
MQSMSLEEYIAARQTEPKPEEPSGRYDFEKLCALIKEAFFEDWENRESSGVTLEIQKRAIIGYEKEKDFFKNRINELIRDFESTNAAYPSWYENLTDAVYHENWGLAGLSEWFLDEWKGSSSAKIIGENIFFMKDGKMQLMPQTISPERKEQLIKAFMLLTPEERMNKAYYELYMLDGTRVTVFTEPLAKKGNSSIVFRRYIIPTLSFEEQARRGTIPESLIPALRCMVDIGYNVIFMGAVRTAKTTFLATWQSYEDKNLEGVMVETDPEIPLHLLMPKSPVMQLIADGEELSVISKNLLRSDADYFIMAEARDGTALDTALRIASKGTKRMKLTFHSRNPYHFPLEAAMEIAGSTGGDIELIMRKLAANFDYLFHFVQLKDKRMKRLKGIYEMGLGSDGEISIKEILSYDFEKDSWKLNY